ncbi:MAG: hypothetical protein JWQ23_3149, partial [Herminiimonas sp.]|nr:hypothetical protein [Herminiimonas sp.]
MGKPKIADHDLHIGNHYHWIMSGGA